MGMSKTRRTPSSRPKRRPNKTVAAKTNAQEKGRTSKKDSVIALLQKPEGATIKAMMKATGWQQHSVRGFFASVVQKKLRLKLSSKKVDGNRTYRIAGPGSARSKSGRSNRRVA